ncbi:protein LOW PSII ACCUMULATION 1, chloroplastic [Gossypium australe]|uniref:Protein LOW PSII ACCUMULATION 1, chloroplastic n=1 Tax=Gossypium australe TaxID=47621 RepID=A0A5B6VZM7_9ROSI|nr:protein LOW PSII ACCUMULATION 1, chloroplastic [Gossypium australe]
MAVAALALNQQLLCFSYPKIRAKSRPWFPQKTTLLNSQKKPHIFIVSCSSSPTSQSPEANVQTAESCVNLGLSLFSKGRVRIDLFLAFCYSYSSLTHIIVHNLKSEIMLVKDALVQFETALSLDPNPVEAQAALYNKACCHAYQGEAKKAAECLRTALRDYNLKFGTILNDPDLASLRASPEFKELQEEARLGGEDIGYSFRRDLKLISEVQAPFRGVRRFFYVAFSAAAGISLLFTVPRLFHAIKGSDGAPDIWETVGNAGINIGGIIVLVALFFWDNKKEEEQLAQISRNETLSRLPLRLSTNRIVELVQLRDTVRPVSWIQVILAGKKESVSSALQKAERFRTELLRRGVLLVPVIWGEGRTPQVDKKGFGVSKKAATVLPSIGEDFEKRAQSITAKSKLKAEIRFKAAVVSPEEWERWIRDQQESEGVTPGEDVYIILRLDGLVRRSGKGMPDWSQIVQELPPMEALLSKLER